MKFRSKKSASMRFQSALRRMNERRDAELSSPNNSLLQYESTRKFPRSPSTSADSIDTKHQSSPKVIDADPLDIDAAED